jgi:hypothetical protein
MQSPSTGGVIAEIPTADDRSGRIFFSTERDIDLYELRGTLRCGGLGSSPHPQGA